MSRICKNVNCNNYVPTFFISESGKKHNCQRRKYCLECSPFGKHNTRQLENNYNRKIKKCPICGLKHNQKCNTCMACYFQKKQKRRTQEVIDIVGHSCWFCGYNKTWKNLCFHHIYPEDKMFGLSTRELVGTKWEKVIKEIKKCILVCHNCHGEIHNNFYSDEKIKKIWQTKWNIIK